MFQRIFISVLTLIPFVATGQQFIGADASFGPMVSRVPLNPAWVVTATDGTEINVSAISGLAGTNAYRFSKEYVTGGFSGQAVEGSEYFKDLRSANKHVWGNTDLIGPSFSVALNQNDAVGFYCRVREVMRGGNISNKAFQFIGDNTNIPLKDTVSFGNAGFTTHTFSEFGFSYGRLLKDDLYHIMRAGITVKYLIGMSAGSILTHSTKIVKTGVDTITKLDGDLRVIYSDNVQPFVDGDPSNDPNSWFERHGKKSLGLDLGFQYEYHPDGDPNKASAYLFSFSASITDIGSIKYQTQDSVSADYKLQIKKNAYWWQYRDDFSNADFFSRLSQDTFVKKQAVIKTFKVGLPTALHLNLDWNLGNHVFMQLNTMLNLRANKGDVYNSGYVNYFNLTPRYEYKKLSFALPLTFIGYQTITLGAVVHVGPFFVGSSSILSTALYKQVNALDGYAGLSLKFKKKKPYA